MSDSELLKKACARIEMIPEPAFIKDSALTYVTVNAAYARLFHQSPAEMVGRSSRPLTGASDGEDSDRREKECRALVFGEDQVALCFDETGKLAREICIERFLADNDHAFLFGSLHPVREERAVREGPVREDRTGQTVAAAPAVPAASAKLSAPIIDNGLLDGALDMLEMGIGIYDKGNVLIYCNAQFINYLNAFGIEVKPGATLREIVEYAFDQHVRDCGATAPKLTSAEREAWIAEHMAPFDEAYSDTICQLVDGRWIRSLNKRLETGLLIAIRHDVTDFKDQEMLLRSKAGETEMLREVLEDLPVPVFVRDEDRRLSYANAAYEAMLGSDRDNFIGKTETEMFPHAAERFRLENDRVMAGEAIDKAEEVMFPDGSVVPVLTRLRRVTTSDGAHHLVGSRTDISMIREAQKKAEKLSQDLETILSGVPVGIGILDRDFVFEYANPAFYDFWDASERFDLVGKPYRDYLKANFDSGSYADRKQSFEAIYDERIAVLAAGDGHPPIEVRTLGGMVIVLSATRLSEDKLMITYMDITAVRRRDEEIQQARAALDQHGALMRDATGAMSQGLLILHGSDIVFANDALAGMLELPADLAVAGHPWRDIFRTCAARGDLGDQEQAVATLRGWTAAIDSGQPIFASIHLTNGRWVQMEAKVTSGEHWLAVFTDVTEAKEREADLTRLLKRAEAADRAKSEFLANMSHEIRTPMNGVLGMAELLAKSQLDGRQKTFIDIIVKSGNALLTIINDILDFSKIDAGQMKLRKAPFDPVEAIEDVATLLSSAAADKDIELIVRGDVSVRETVLGDAGRFRQIVTNLVGNAVKFTEKGHVFIDLKSRAIGDDQMMLAVRIEDTGLGIPQEKLDSVFEKFSQVDTSSTRRHEGTGLGLAITAGLVELFGGHVRVESQFGVGSVFTVELPFAVVSERKPAGELPVNTSGARILVVDDNPVNRRILTEQLAMWGFDTVAAEDGAEGLAFLNEAHRIGIAIDAIVLDYHMPGMNGLDFAKTLRADPRFDMTGIAFLTSMDMAGDDTIFATLNVQAHLMKPARANLLRTTVIDVVRTMRMRRRAADAVRLAEQQQAAETGDGAVPPGARPSIDTQASDLAAAARQLALPSPPGLDVLIAEDNDVNQIVFTQILQSTGWRFRIVGNGAEAVEAWQTDDPAVIIMDVSMPVMNGHQATRRIRELEGETGAHVPIIGVTAHALESDRELCFQAGMDDYLSKPISPEALEDKIRLWIGGAVVVSVTR